MNESNNCRFANESNMNENNNTKTCNNSPYAPDRIGYLNFQNCVPFTCSIELLKSITPN